jgi:hypothetical protein
MNRSRRMNKYSKLAVAVLLCWLPAVASPQHSPAKPAPADTRTVIALDAPARAALFSEMRLLLENVRLIVEAVAKNDLKAAARAARASGMEAASEAAEEMEKSLPKSFAMLGMSMHKEFDAMAAEAEKGADAKRILSSLGETMKKCAACHASYQVRLKASSASKK